MSLKFSHGRVIQNSELERGNHGRISSNEICFWDDWIITGEHSM